MPINLYDRGDPKEIFFPRFQLLDFKTVGADGLGLCLFSIGEEAELKFVYPLRWIPGENNRVGVDTLDLHITRG